MSAELLPIPALLATAAVHQHLVRKGLRTSTGLVVETGSAREVHHFALLAGYGAEAIHPYLTLETLASFARRRARRFGAGSGVPLHQGDQQGTLQGDVEDGHLDLPVLLRRADLRGGRARARARRQVFHRHASNVEGIGLPEVATEAARLHAAAFGNDPLLANALDAGGEYAYRVRGEEHMWTPDSIAKLQHATRSGSFATYREYAALINDQNERMLTLRGLFEFRFAPAPVPIEEVEPAAEIVKRFATGAMSLGSISTEAHTTLAVAMNRIGGKSNTGEGGEDAHRYALVKAGETLASRIESAVVDIALKEGDSLRSKIKQVASARFGVTAEYLVVGGPDPDQDGAGREARRGRAASRPQGVRVHREAALRRGGRRPHLAGAAPRHLLDRGSRATDPRSQERESARVDLGEARFETGVGTVAAGVAKAKADHVTIAGHDGGTGASPVSSIKHAGHAVGTGPRRDAADARPQPPARPHIAVQVDGQIKTGRDVVIGALLGADEFGFSTAPLVTAGCIMMRKCHLNTCPVGVATQDPELRKKFTGKPEHVVNYFFFVAEEARELMAKLGVRKFDELIGRADLLDTRRGIEHWKAKGLDFARIFYQPPMPPEVARHRCEDQDHGLAGALDHALIAAAAPALDKKLPVRLTYRIRNANRSVGAMLSGVIATRYGHAGLADDTIHVAFDGIAGQSFGAFLARGVTFELQGATNDYVGKGLSGGRIVVYPDPACPASPEDNIVVGNTVMYGAIDGEAYFRGVAGERFCVRNSGAYGGRRRHRRSRVRVHDRRNRRRPWPHRAQLRRRA